jgi:preprotein translocase subunit SecD
MARWNESSMSFRSGPRHLPILAGLCFNHDAIACPSGRLAIELDGLIITAPSVNEPVFAGDVSITGSLNELEAKQLERVLRYGSLPVAFDVITETTT